MQSSKWKLPCSIDLIADGGSAERDGISQPMIDAQVHLAHAVVRYMDVSGPGQLQEHGISGISELVELISKVRVLYFRCGADSERTRSSR